MRRFDIDFNNIYCADLETTTDPSKDAGVWLCGYCKVADKKVITFRDLNGMMSMFSMFEDKSIVFFHNLRFDASFIVPWLLSNGYKPVEKMDSHTPPKTFTVLVGGLNDWFSLDIKFSQRTWITLRDSMKLVSSSLEDAGRSFECEHSKRTDLVENGSMDYKRHNTECPITKEEMEYFKNDCIVLAEVIEKRLSDMPRLKFTTGSESLNEYKQMLKNKEIKALKDFPQNYRDPFEYWFPSLEETEDTYVRRTYRGGWCYLNDKYKGKVITDGCTLDVNSLYPSMMHSNSGNIYPYGNGHLFEFKWQLDDLYRNWYKYKKFYFVTFHVDKLTLKDGKFPFLRRDKYFKFDTVEYDTVLEDYQDTLSCIDFKLMCDSYKIEGFKFIVGVWYHAKAGMFDAFIDKHYEGKRNSTGAIRQLHKIRLNSFYGKFGTNPKNTNHYFKEDGSVYTTTTNSQSKYVPIASAVTAYGRYFIIKSAEANYDNFIYADTDSLHLACKAEDAKGISIGSELLQFKVESEWNKACFYRLKTYIEESEDGIDIKACGLSKDGKDYVVNIENPVENFCDTFSNPIPDGAIRTIHTKTGNVLVNTYYNSLN